MSEESKMKAFIDRQLDCAYNTVPETTIPSNLSSTGLNC